MRLLILLLLCVGLFGVTNSADAGSHLWVVNEVFSNATGTVQFIELHCPFALAELALENKWVKSTATSNQFTFPADLSGSTADKYLLLATASFAALPGAPTPDYIIPENFFSTSADTLEYWLYVTGDMTIPTGMLPLDGTGSIQLNAGVLAVGLNSPTNYASQTGSVDAGGPPPPPEFQRGDANQDGTLGIGDAIGVLGYLFLGMPTTCSHSMDVDDDGSATIGDPIGLLAYLFLGGPPPAAPFNVCGADTTAGGTLGCVSHSACP